MGDSQTREEGEPMVLGRWEFKNMLLPKKHCREGVKRGGEDYRIASLPSTF